MRRFVMLLIVLLASLAAFGQSLQGCKLSSNEFDPDSTSNPFGHCGSEFSPDSINNPFGKYGSEFSPYGVNNPFATQAPKIVAPDGTYLGRYSTNEFDTDSTSNPFGVHGIEFSPFSVHNEFSPYGSEFGTESPNNPFTTSAPYLVSGDDNDPQ